jgi:hypothetical protein
MLLPIVAAMVITFYILLCLRAYRRRDSFSVITCICVYLYLCIWADRRRVALDITSLLPCCAYRRRDSITCMLMQIHLTWYVPQCVWLVCSVSVIFVPIVLYCDALYSALAITIYDYLCSYTYVSIVTCWPCVYLIFLFGSFSFPPCLLALLVHLTSWSVSLCR